MNGRIVDLKKGNTEICAEFIQKAVGGDLFEVETVNDYSVNYHKCTEEASKELKENTRPELKKYLEDISEYDNIFVCGPCWWGTYPAAVFTQLERLDFTGKKVMALMTHEGSGLGKEKCKIKEKIDIAKRNKKTMNKKDVMIVIGAGQISMAIARRMGYGKKIVMGDKNINNAKTIAEIMNNAGYDVEPVEMDLSSRESILKLIAKAQEYGEIKMLVNGAGVSPSQAPIEAILKVDLYGTAVLLEEVGKVIAEGGCGVTISSQSGWRMPQLTVEEDAALATTPTEEMLNLEILQPENIKDTLHAYQMAKRCNEKRVMAQSVEWGKRGARLNDIAPGIIVTPLAIDEFNGPRGDFYKNMFAKCPAGRPGTADEVANVAELLLSDKGAFITGSTFLIDGGATSSYYYGPLKPEN